MVKLILLIMTVLVSACHLDELLKSHPPIEPKKCYMNAYYIKNGVDTVWLGTQEVTCPKE